MKIARLQEPLKMEVETLEKPTIGPDEVLIKVGQGGGNWGVAFRMYDPKQELVYSTTKEGE